MGELTHTLSELLVRVEAATGPDREIDCLIHEWEHPECSVAERGTYYGEPTGEYFGPPDGRGVQEVFAHARPVTSSIDAALALVERRLPGCGVDMATYPDKGRAEAFLRNPVTKAMFANTLALAILTALLRALQSQDGKP